MFGSCLSRGYLPLLTSREAAKQTGPSKGKHIFLFYFSFLFFIFKNMFGSCLSRGYSPLLMSREAAKQTGPFKGNVYIQKSRVF